MSWCFRSHLSQPGIGDALDTTLLQSFPASFDAELHVGSISGALERTWELTDLGPRGGMFCCFWFVFFKCALKRHHLYIVFKKNIHIYIYIDPFKRAGSCVEVEVHTFFEIKRMKPDMAG